MPPAADTSALLLGFEDAAEAAPYFERCRTLAVVNDHVGLNNDEQGLPVMLCRTTGPWPNTVATPEALQLGPRGCPRTRDPSSFSL